MRNYELTIVLPGVATAAKKKSTQEKIEKLVEGSKGKVGKVEDWGKRDLSYKIKKPASPSGGSTSGVFLHFPLELEAGSAKELLAKLEKEEDIIRLLLVRREK